VGTGGFCVAIAGGVLVDDSFRGVAEALVPEVGVGVGVVVTVPFTATGVSMGLTGSRGISAIR
jgi:hypothetical protein